MTVTTTLQVPFLTAFKFVPDTRQVVREAALTITLTVDPVTTFSPVYVAIDFVDNVFFVERVGFVAIVVTDGGAT